MAMISIDLHFEKDHQKAEKVRIKTEGKIKEIGTVASRCDRLPCLHIGLSTAPTVPTAGGLARQGAVARPCERSFRSVGVICRQDHRGFQERDG